MFSRCNNASKVALIHLVGRLKLGGFILLDTQFITNHLIQFGAVEITRAAYHSRLASALSVVGDFMAPLEDRTNYVFMSLCYPTWDKKGGLDIESVQ